MSEEVRARCLEPFFSTKGEQGTGLGLSTTFGIIKRHDAELEIESQLGRGTTFRLSFPSNVKTLTAAVVDEVAAVPRPLRVLVVDDNSVPREVVRKYLAADGHHVVTADSGVDALATFEAGEFDLVVTDHSMPGMNGTQLAESIKAARPGQPILMLSGFTDPSLDIQQKPAGVDLMLTKPIPQKELRGALAQLCPS
jgi:CheY-like chemotaxis protein